MRRVPRLQLVAVVASLITAIAVVPATASPAPAPTSTDAGPAALDIPGMHGSQSVTLVTGDRVTLTADGGHYVATAEAATRASGATPHIEVRTRTAPDGTVRSLTATPDDVQGAIDAGVVDAGLFDLSGLLDGSGRAAALPVTLKYDAAADQPGVQAADLPGVTVDAVHATSRTVDVHVDPERAAKFWAALAPDLSYGDGMSYLFKGQKPQLAGGVSAVWRTGHRSSVAPQVDTQEPKQTVTVLITKKIGDPFYCSGAGARVWILCLNIPQLVSVDGSSPGTPYVATAGKCLEEVTCSEIKLTYEVPAGKYLLDGRGMFKVNNSTQYLNLMVPEFDVTGDRTLRVDGDAATRAGVDTPRPSEAYVMVTGSFRTFSNGWGGSTVGFYAWGNLNYWALPSSPVTVGQFHLSEAWLLGKPMVTMSVTGPTRIQLHPMMSGYEAADPDRKVVRFRGHHRVGLVDVGLGLPEDFAGVDVEGKLVLMQIDAAAGHGGCDLGAAPLQRAMAAGAVGVLVDPFSTHGPFPEHECDLPITPAAWGPQQPPQVLPNIPFAALPGNEADQLRGLLADGEVQVDVDGFAGMSPYTYNLEMYQPGRIPDSMHRTLTDSDLQTEVSSFHSATDAPAELQFSAWNPVEDFVGGVLYKGLTSPRTITISRGPISPDVVWQRGASAVGSYSSGTLDVVDQPGTHDVEWNASPAAPGVVSMSPEVFAAQPGQWEDSWAVEICTFCREGDVFFPTLNMISGAAPGTTNYVHMFAPEKVKMYADGVELPQTWHFFYGPSYHLPAAATDYRLTGETSTTDTTWTFRSAQGDQERAPQGFLCPSWFSNPGGGCQFEPMLFLRYRMDTDLHNAVLAHSHQNLVISAYRPLGKAAQVTDMHAFVSADSGKTWQEVRLRALGGGDFAAAFNVPAYENTDGALALKVAATAADGSTIHQTIRKAVTVKPRR